MKNTTKAHVALFGANLIYGASFLIAKGVMPQKIGPSAFIFLRVLGAGLLFWLIKSFINEKVEKKDFLLLILCGFLGTAANQLFFFHGLSLTSPIDASVIMTAAPILVLIFSAIILKEKITSLKIIGIALGTIGAITLVSYGNKLGGTSSALGNLFVFLNASSYALYLVLVKPLMKKYNPFTVISYVFLFGFMFILPFGIYDISTTNFSLFTTNTYISIAFIIIGTTFLTYLFNIYALKYVSPSVNGSYIYLQPAISFLLVIVFATFFDQSMYAQDINFVKILSSLLVGVGVYLISKK